MIQKEITRHKTIQTKSPKTFDSELGKLLEEVALCEPEVTRFYDSEAGHIAYVTWKESIIKAEDVRDEYEMKGISYHCGDCPYYEHPNDKRIVYSTCGLGQRASYGKRACVELYEKIQKGDVNMEVSDDK